MKFKPLASLLALLLVAAPLVFSQSKDTGAIVGATLDEENAPLPGVTITLSSPQLMGNRIVVTGADGSFRFPALPPGDYAVTAQLAGFTTVRQENVRVSTTVRLTIDFTMKLATLEEEVTVIAESPTVDIKSSETASVSLGDDLLRNIPFSNFAMDILDLAPGVWDDVAYGASDGTGISYQMDGVDVSDPDGGTAWVFMDPHTIEEAKIMGIGAAAEYGNFTGIIFNLVTKSGGNEFSGHFESDFQGKKSDKPKGLWGTENNQAYIDDFPGLSSPSLKLYEFGAHLGGPILKDKVWFYLGAHYFRDMEYRTGFPESVDYKMPRAFIKINAQLTPSTSIMTFYEFDAYNGINRGAASDVSPEACVNQDSPDHVGNFSLTQIINPKTFLDLKAAFFIGYYYLEPEVGRDISGHWNDTDLWLHESYGWFGLFDRWRYQANVNITHYAEDFIHGNHDFKFGMEFEYGRVRDRTGYTGPNNWYYIDLYEEGAGGYMYNGPYIAYQYEGYDTDTRYTRIEEFVQDSWKVSDRLNLNFGLRLSHFRGTIKDISGAVYSNSRIAPRIGFTYDILGDKTTVLKGHYGQFTEAMITRYHARLNPASAYSDFIGWYYWPPTETWEHWFTITHEDLYSMDPDIKHPYMNQFTASIERELFRDASLSATFIYRDWKNIMGRVDNAAIWSPVVINDPETGTAYTVYENLNDGNPQYVIKNLDKDDPGINLTIGDTRPYRRYWGLEFMLNKRFSDGWQLLASYVYGKAYGTTNNVTSEDVGWGGDVEDPNYWINADGNSTNDPTHMLKIQGTYVLPFGVYLTGYFRAITGRSWTRRIRTSKLYHGRVTFFTEPRGSNHYPIRKILDVRLEKTFTLAEKFRLGLMVDIFNVFNDDTITSWGTRIDYDWLLPGDPDYYSSTDGHDLYGIVRPRQARVGIRLMF